jgi:hypothetical protein
VKVVVVITALLAVLAGYDYWGFHRAMAFERDSENSATSVAHRWANLFDGHPSLPLFWPSLARQATARKNEWTVKAAGVQVASGAGSPELTRRLSAIKDHSPQLAIAIHKVEEAQELVRQEERWKEVYSDAKSLSAVDDPDKPLAQLDAFLREFPDSPRRTEALAVAEKLKKELAKRRGAAERKLVDDIVRSESLPGASLADLIERTQRFLADHPDSPLRFEVQQHLDRYLDRLDLRDIERARNFSQQSPTNFAVRIERYQDYLKAHQSGGRFISEAMEAKDSIRREWDIYAYRLAYDQFLDHPDDVAEVARRLRDYLRDHAVGRFVSDARAYLDWWE